MMEVIGEIGFGFFVEVVKVWEWVLFVGDLFGI